MSRDVPADAADHLRHACGHLRQRCDVALLTRPSSVTYFAGYTGPGIPGYLTATCAGGAFVGVDAASGRVLLGLPTADRELFAQDLVSGAHYFDGYVQDHESSATDSYLDSLAAVLLSVGAAGAPVIGVEKRSLPMAIAEWISANFPLAKLVDIEGAVQAARLTKTRRERFLVARANVVADRAHSTFATLLQGPGPRESDVFERLRSDVEAEAGGRIPLEGELVSGPRTAVVRYPGGPTTRRIMPGDAAILDLSAQIGGYWFDCTNTHIVGNIAPTREQARLVDVAQRAFDAAVSALRPGVQARQVWAAAARVYQDRSAAIVHYFGHQIGVEVNEAPRIVSFDESVIEPGMVFELELGAYQGHGGTFGCRFEKTVIVDEDATRVVSQFRWGIGLE